MYHNHKAKLSCQKEDMGNCFKKLFSNGGGLLELIIYKLIITKILYFVTHSHFRPEMTNAIEKTKNFFVEYFHLYLLSNH